MGLEIVFDDLLLTLMLGIVGSSIGSLLCVILRCVVGSVGPMVVIVF